MSHRNSESFLEFGRGVKMGHSHKNGMIVAWLIVTFRKYVTKVHPLWIFFDEEVVRETPLPRTKKWYENDLVLTVCFFETARSTESWSSKVIKACPLSAWTSSSEIAPNSRKYFLYWFSFLIQTKFLLRKTPKRTKFTFARSFCENVIFELDCSKTISKLAISTLFIR